MVKDPSSNPLEAEKSNTDPDCTSLGTFLTLVLAGGTSKLFEIWTKLCLSAGTRTWVLDNIFGVA